jgi:DNA-binding CsgD family transcriptional regulator
MVDLSAYVDRVFACEDVSALKRLLISTFSELGAKAISGHAFPYGGGGDAKARDPLISTFPESVSAIHRSEQQADDPVMYATMTLGAPVHFLKIEQSLHLTGHSKALLQAMRDAGLRDGVTTPAFAKPGAYGYFVAAFDRPRPDLTQPDLRRIKFLFSEFFYRYRELAVRRASTLSKREREVLVAIVNDKSNTEIAEFLGVSENTVETYVRRCFAKLDVTSRTQAALRYLGGLADATPH